MHLLGCFPLSNGPKLIGVTSFDFQQFSCSLGVEAFGVMLTVESRQSTKEHLQSLFTRFLVMLNLIENMQSFKKVPKVQENVFRFMLRVEKSNCT